MEFVIKGELPDLNQIIKASKSHYMSYSNMKKDYTALVMISAGNHPKIERADVEITWYAKNRRKDPDNIAAGVKFILDGLVKGGVLENDGWNQINRITHDFAIDKENPRIEVKLLSKS